MGVGVGVGVGGRGRVTSSPASNGSLSASDSVAKGPADGRPDPSRAAPPPPSIVSICDAGREFIETMSSHEMAFCSRLGLGLGLANPKG